ncbi:MULTISPECIES: hypothetical protein [Cyanophyceae]|nr:hypothetical protein [Microcoleus sp. FACHB-831]
MSKCDRIFANFSLHVVVRSLFFSTTICNCQARSRLYAMLCDRQNGVFAC